MERFGYLVLCRMDGAPCRIGHVFQEISEQAVSQPFCVVGEATRAQAQEQEDFIAPLENRKPVAMRENWLYYRVTTD